MPQSPPSSPSSDSVLPALHHALSGSLGTLVSTCSLYPLSLAIARQQVQRQLLRRCRRRRGDRGENTPPGPAPARTPDPEHPPVPEPLDNPHLPSPPKPPSLPRHPSPPDLPNPPGSPGPPGPPGLCNPPPTPAPTSPAPPSPRPCDPLQSEPVSAGAPVQEQGREPPLPIPTGETGIVDVFSQIWNSDGNGGLRAFYTGLAQGMSTPPNSSSLAHPNPWLPCLYTTLPLNL